MLVIEDNIDAAESLKEVLQLEEHQVDTAFNGAEGLEKVRRFSPDVVLCDIGLPGMSGYDVARALRSDAELKDVTLVALTGYAGPDDMRCSREAGFDYHMAKPPDITVLERIIAQARGRVARALSATGHEQRSFGGRSRQRPNACNLRPPRVRERIIAGSAAADGAGDDPWGNGASGLH